MGVQTSTHKYGLLFMLFALFVLFPMAYAQEYEVVDGIRYQTSVSPASNMRRAIIQEEGTDELQQLLDRLADSPTRRAAGTVTDIDLSAYSAPRTTTLYVRNGVNVRFINGTLTRATSLTDAPLVQILGDSKLHVAQSAAISGNNFFVSGSVLVDILDGELDLEGGKISGNSNGKTDGISVWAKNEASVVVVNAGEIENLAASSSRHVYLYGGNIEFISLRYFAYIKGDVIAYCSFQNKDAYLYIEGGTLGSSANITLSDFFSGQTVVKNVSNQAAINRFKIGYSGNITGSRDDYQLSYENNSLVVRPKQASDPNLIYNEEQLRTRLKEIADNKESSVNKPVKLTVVPDGFTISSSVLVSSCYVEITGGRLTIVKNTSHTPFVVFENAGLTLNNIEIDFNSFDSYYRGLENEGGYLTIGSGVVFLNAVGEEWFNIPFYYLYGGITTISPTNRNVNNEVFGIYFSNFKKNAQLRFTSSVGYIRVTGNWKDFDSEEPYTLIKGSGYTLKESDFKSMHFENLPDNIEVYYDNSDYSVKLRKVDPNYITDEDWLQKRLDEIAAQKPTEPVTLTIREEGITITKSIFASSGCNAIITGGKISTPSSMPNADMVFSILQGADITFSDITLELCMLSADYCYHFFSYGNLTFSNLKVITEKLSINGYCRIYGFNNSLPMLYLSKSSRIDLLSGMKDTWVIDGDWTHFDVEIPYTIVSGYNYTVRENDYSRMQFVNLPDDIEAVYNEELRVVQLQKKAKECDLQSLIDGLCESGGDIPVPDGITDIGCQDDPLQCAVDLTVDGGDNKVEAQVICFCRRGPDMSQIVRINPYSSFTIRNYNVRSNKYENQYFQVYGTLIIDVNVYIYNFVRFIHLMPGGRVIWRGGHVEDVDQIIYNEGGTVEIEGDFDNGGKTYVNEKGSTLIIRGGTFKGGIDNYGTLIIEGGTIDGGQNPGLINRPDATATIENSVIKNDDSNADEILNYDKGKLVIGNDTEVGENGEGCIWSETDVWIEGGVRVMDIHIKRGATIHVIGKLSVVWRIHFFVFNEFDVYVPFIVGDEGYKLTEEDVEHIHIDLPDGYRWIIYDQKIVIVRIPYNVETIVEYLNFFGPQGTIEHPWSFVYNKTNIDINIDWHIIKDYHLIFDEGTFSLNGGNIYVDEGACLWLKNIRFRGTNQHIYVSGTLYIDENVDLLEIVRFIHICKGGRIYFMAKPKLVVNIYIDKMYINIDNAIIFNLLEEWLQYISIELPEGYEWQYDKTQRIITIKEKSSDGILELTADDAQQPIYDLYGRRVENPVEGQLYIRNGKKYIAKRKQ